MRAGMAGADKAMFRFVAGHRAAGETREETRALGSGLRLAGGLSSGAGARRSWSPRRSSRTSGARPTTGPSCRSSPRRSSPGRRGHRAHGGDAGRAGHPHQPARPRHRRAGLAGARDAGRLRAAVDGGRRGGRARLRPTWSCSLLAWVGAGVVFGRGRLGAGAALAARGARLRPLRAPGRRLRAPERHPAAGQRLHPERLSPARPTVAVLAAVRGARPLGGRHPLRLRQHRRPDDVGGAEAPRPRAPPLQPRAHDPLGGLGVGAHRGHLAGAAPGAALPLRSGLRERARPP